MSGSDKKQMRKLKAMYNDRIKEKADEAWTLELIKNRAGFAIMRRWFRFWVIMAVAEGAMLITLVLAYIITGGAR